MGRRPSAARVTLHRERIDPQEIDRPGTARERWAAPKKPVTRRIGRTILLSVEPILDDPRRGDVP
jgi:hypothetical protein